MGSAWVRILRLGVLSPGRGRGYRFFFLPLLVGAFTFCGVWSLYTYTKKQITFLFLLEKRCTIPESECFLSTRADVEGLGTCCKSLTHLAP
jgi:hypothetical protein